MQETAYIILCFTCTLCKPLRMANRPPLIGSAEVCQRLGIDRSTLTRRVARGEMTPVQKLPGHTGAFLFEAAEVERALAAQDAISKAKAASA